MTKRNLFLMIAVAITCHSTFYGSEEKKETIITYDADLGNTIVHDRNLDRIMVYPNATPADLWPDLFEQQLDPEYEESSEIEEPLEILSIRQPRPMPKHKTRPCGLEFLPKDSMLRNPQFVAELSQDPKKKKSLEKIAGTLSNISRLHELDEELYITKKLKKHHFRYFPEINGLKYKFAQSNCNKIKSKIDSVNKTDFNIAKTRVACSKKGHAIRILRDIDNGIENAKNSTPQR